MREENSPGDNSAGIHLRDCHLPLVDKFFEPEFEPGSAREQDRQTLVEGEERDFVAPACRGEGIRQPEVGFAGTGRTREERGGAARQTAAEERVQSIESAGDVLVREIPMMFRSHEARKNGKATGFDQVIVISAR